MKVAMIDCPLIHPRDHKARRGHSDKIVDLLDNNDIVICDKSGQDNLVPVSGVVSYAHITLSEDLRKAMPELGGELRRIIDYLAFGTPVSRKSYSVPLIDPAKLYSVLQELEIEPRKLPV